jgi:hypothetical protein
MAFNIGARLDSIARRLTVHQAGACVNGEAGFRRRTSSQNACRNTSTSIEFLSFCVG